MILLAAFAGLRVHEIAKVRAEHLDLIGRQMTVTGKGGVTSVLPLHHRIIEQAYQMPREGWWFPGPEHGHQRRESIGGTIKEAMIRAGVPGSAHQLRHWFGTELVDTGSDLRTAQELMRHASLTSTEIYTKVTDERRVAGIERLNPWRSAVANIAAALITFLALSATAALVSANNSHPTTGCYPTLQGAGIPSTPQFAEFSLEEYPRGKLLRCA